MDMSLFCSI